MELHREQRKKTQVRNESGGETDRKEKDLKLTDLSKYLRYGCENTHISAVSVSHRAAVYDSVPTGLMNVSQKTVSAQYRRVLRM